MESKNKTRLNLAGLLASYFVTSRITPVLVLGCLLLGVLAINLTPREENPQIVVPAANVIVSLPGASPGEIEQLIIRPLENTIKQISGVDHTFAVASDSLGMLTVQFDVGENTEQSLVKLYDQVIGQQKNFPPGASMPMVQSIDVDRVPVVTVTLASEQYDDYALKRIADRMLDKLRSLRPISAMYVRGGRDREVRVELDLAKLQAYHIPVTQLRRAIQSQNVSIPLGDTVQNNDFTQVYLNGQLSQADELNQLVIGVQDQKPIYLSDVARVVDGPSEQRDTLSRFTFGPADQRFNQHPSLELNSVTLAIAKKPNTNAVFMAEDVLSRIEDMKSTFIPAGIEVIVTRNDGEKADQAVNVLIYNLGIAIFCVFLITIFFLGWKSAIIVGFSIPLILSLTLGADFLFGPTINRVTLFALILSLGMLVDGPIVVVENIYRHFNLSKSNDRRSLAIQATNEIGNATNLATVAVMLGFSSMLFALGGMTGQYFYPVAFNVPITMLVSLIVAYIVTPWAAHRWLHDVKTSTLSSPLKRSVGTNFIYRRALIPGLKNPRWRNLTYLVVIVALLLSCLQPVWQFIRPSGIDGPTSLFGVDLAMLLKDNKNTFNITIDMPENTSVEKTDQIARQVGELMRRQPEVRHYLTWVGQTGVIDFNGLLRGAASKSGTYIAEIRVNLSNKTERKLSSITMVRELREDILTIQRRHPGSLIQLVEDPPGPPMRASVLAEIYGKDLKVMREIAAHTKMEFERTYDMVEVNDSTPADIPIYRVHIDKEKAALSGISTAEVATLLRTLIDGEVIGNLHVAEESNPVAIKLNIPRHREINPEILSMVSITNQNGDSIPLASIASVKLEVAEKPIFHKDYERVVYVAGELSQATPIFSVLHLNQQLQGFKTSDGQQLQTGNLGLERTDPETINGYQLLWDGEMRLTLDTFGDLINALGLALVFIYILLVAYYQSFSIPMIAMSAIPLGLIGVFPGHWIMGQAFTSTSMIGIVALAGIVVRNSLLIIDFVLDHLDDGMPLQEAILEATVLRLRPIILTAISTVLGSAIMITDPIFGGLAISMIFGTLVATLLTIVIIPFLLYQLLEKQGFGEGADKNSEAQS
ncbi:MAG: efflux RND transporter permease subunit [Porticoccaceae bacterium]|nr:efflux RND transporter permease subunit [Porticoccaceae bacterium]